MVPRKNDPVIVRGKIIDRTLEIFSEKGHRFTMDELARSLGMSKKTLYNIFPDKEELMTAMIDECYDRARDNKQFKRRRDAFRTFNDTIETIVDWCQLLDPDKLSEMEKRYPAVGAHRKERLDASWDETAQILIGAMNDGLIDDVPIPVIRILLESFMNAAYSSDALAEAGISYRDALLTVSTILMKGTVRKKDSRKK